ncbi:MAG: hypothetical protein R3292_00255 [Alcanivorax sp.]|nr:hypothetical protein [Alcanivorax sp.]
MKVNPFTALVLGATMSLAGCGGASNSSNDSTRSPVHLYFHNQLTDFTNASDAAVTVSVYPRDSSNALFDSVSYSTDGQSGMSFTLNADTEKVPLHIKNSTTDLLDTSSSLVAGGNYTQVFMGDITDGNLKLGSYRQSVQSIPSNYVRIRFIHALSQHTGAINVAVEGATVVTGLAYGDVSDYQQGSLSSSTQLQATISDSSGTLGTASCALSLGKSYDVIVAHKGYSDSNLALFCQQVEGS